tara:strand:+ start:2001 stop:3620 length:1620 start_codon:yes stop_codon:yes gene_type:complete
MFSFFRRVWPLVVSALLGFFFAIVLFLPELSARNKNAYRILKTKMKVLEQIISFVNHFYFDQVDFDKIMDGSFRGLMEELDPHSTYIPAKEQENISELFKGNFQGIGIEFDILDGYITVISPIPDSPSELVGLMPGDKIIAIDKKDAYKITKSEVFKKLRGKKGSKVLVTISRLGASEPFDVTIVRDNIPIYSVGSATMIDDETGYIFLRRFSATTKDEVISAIDTLLSQGMEKLLFDLRGNSGGYLEQAAAISDIFINTNDTLVYTKGKIKESNQVFLSNTSSKNTSEFSLIVLINRGSASAAEIVSGAVQDLDRGLVVGETSFGKGLVQRQLPLDNGAALRVTIARYYTPSGRLIQRPYEDGNDLAYYRELYSQDRESKIDSLKKLRPRYKTKSGRTVYGGGGITPDIYIPYKSTLNSETAKIIRSTKRPVFNFASQYASRFKEDYPSFSNFKEEWNVTNSMLQDFFTYLNSDSIKFQKDSIINNDLEFLKNRIKSELAGSIWGKNENTNIRLRFDNQVTEALKHFNEADAFIQSSN